MVKVATVDLNIQFGGVDGVTEFVAFVSSIATIGDVLGDRSIDIETVATPNDWLIRVERMAVAKLKADIFLDEQDTLRGGAKIVPIRSNLDGFVSKLLRAATAPITVAWSSDFPIFSLAAASASATEGGDASECRAAPGGAQT